MDNPSSMTPHRIVYDDGVTRGFVWASVVWGLIGMLVGLLAALQMSNAWFNFELPWLTFGRIRPLHTNAVIFALVGNMMFAGIYYSMQRLLKTRMASDFLSKLHLWGWQFIILGAAITLPMGLTQSKEYSELEWFLDIVVALIWVIFAINFFWTLKVRREKNLYVAIWFYISTVVTVPVLYIVNNLALPVSGGKSYGIFSGAQDALTQWWYGHNAVAFFLTTPILGIMYYFLPKAADRPVYSYRLSIIHFWALVFIYIWAGPHHLLYTALPDWAQTIGMVFSLMLWAPSWGGMLNGLLTLRGAWHKVRTDPVLKFFVAAVTFYGMATFEGPLLSIKSVSALGHYTDWIIGHVHSGALGWNGFMAAGMFYWLIPRLYGTKLHSKGMADLHFWIGTFGILIYVAAMWVSGITSGLMWRAELDGGLQYPNWAEFLIAVEWPYYFRAIGGGMFIFGWVVMAVNLYKTAKSGQKVNGEAEVVDLAPAPKGGTWGLVFSTPLVMTCLTLLVCFMMAVNDSSLAVVGLVLLVGLCVAIAFQLRAASAGGSFAWHDLLEGRPLAFTILVGLAMLAGGIVELVPGIMLEKKVPLTATGQLAVAPYTPLELEGRDVYVREGCYVCHSQMIRPFSDEFKRYGAPSRIEESMWDHPFQWGSKRTGPDLARVGGTKSNNWHYLHMLNPRDIEPVSIMPAYPWLLDNLLDPEKVVAKIKAMRTLGVPYSDEELVKAPELFKQQAQEIVQDLQGEGVKGVDANCELIALIAYLQRLGKNEVPTSMGVYPQPKDQ